MNNDEKFAVSDEERLDYDDLLFQYRTSMDKIRELEYTVQALLYALRKTNNERLVNEDEMRHFQEMYELESRRANQLFEIVEKLDAPIAGPAYEKKNKHIDLTCPHCYSKNIQPMYGTMNIDGSNHRTHYICEDCHKEFDINKDTHEITTY